MAELKNYEQKEMHRIIELGIKSIIEASKNDAMSQCFVLGVQFGYKSCQQNENYPLTQVKAKNLWNKSID